MITTSEMAANILIWTLTLAGGFFGTRAAWRKRRLRKVRIKVEKK